MDPTPESTEGTALGSVRTSPTPETTCESKDGTALGLVRRSPTCERSVANGFSGVVMDGRTDGRFESSVSGDRSVSMPLTPGRALSAFDRLGAGLDMPAGREAGADWPGMRADSSGMPTEGLRTGFSKLATGFRVLRSMLAGSEAAAEGNSLRSDGTATGLLESNSCRAELMAEGMPVTVRRVVGTGAICESKLLMGPSCD